MAWLRFASPLITLLLALPAAAQSSLGTSNLGAPQPGLSQPVPRGTAPEPQVLRPPPGAQRVAPPAGTDRPPASQRNPAPGTAPARPATPPARAAEPRRQERPQQAAPSRAAPTQAAPQTPVKRPGAAAGAAAGGTAAAAAAAAAVPVPASPAPSREEIEQPSIGTATGLPIPRFVSLRSDDVNLRIGPDTRFPIEWSYQRRDLPVMIVREYNQWRRIRDMEGTEGWVHQSTLAGRRTFLVKTPHELILRAAAAEASPVVAKLESGVVGRIRACRAGNAWCEVSVGGREGFLRRADLWGVGPDEDIQ
jgi:SH3-like domain-containing protein